MDDWEHENEFFLTEGLLYIWWNPKLSAKDNFHADPPVFIQSYHDWMAAHPDVRYFPEPIAGPPMWIFPSAELRQEFNDTFLETRERMKEIIAEGVKSRKEAEIRKWNEQGRPRSEEGVAYYEEGENKILILHDPETGKFITEVRAS